MLKVITDIDDYRPWSGAVDNYEKLNNLDRFSDFEELLEEIYPDGLEMVEINDILWFDFQWVCECLGIPYED